MALAVLSLVAAPPAKLETHLAAIFAAFPPGLTGLWRLSIGLLWLLAVLVSLAAVIRARWALLRDMTLAVLLTVALGLLLGRLVQGSWAVAWSHPAGFGRLEWSPWLRLTIPASIVLVAKPHLIRSLRRLGWWLLGFGSVAAILLGVAPTMAIASLLVAVAAAAVIHLAFGSCRGRPALEDVALGLAALGVETVTLGAADRQPAGVFVLEAEHADGRRLDVKVYGRDSSDTQLLSTAWRTLWFRSSDSPASPGRLQQVEHEAFLTLLANQAGILTQPVVTGGVAPNEDALLVLVAVGEPVAQSSTGWDESRVRRMWAMLDALHAAGIAHGQVDDEHLIVDGDRIGLTDFRAAVVATTPWTRQIDRAQALVTSVLALGQDPAISLASESLGRDELEAMLPFLQADPLTPTLRRALRESGLDVDEVRATAAGVLGVEPPALERLRRVTWGSALKAVLPVLAFIALANVVTGIDLDDLAASLQDASWWFVAVGFLVSQVPRLFQALSALGASSIPVPLARLYLLQLAQAYIALTIPGAAARIAMNVRFFQRHGLPPGSALAVGALDSFAGFLGQVFLLLMILTFSSATLDLDLDSDTTSGLLRLVMVIAALAILALAVTLMVPRFRRPVFERARSLWTEALDAARGLGSPRRLGLLFGGNLGNEVVLALALGAFTVAVGYPVGLAELIFINVTVSLLAGIIPIPGGIGVVEGGLMLGLARAGLPEELAFAVAILYRAATFYLPPIWGFFAFRWLERHKHL